MSSLALIVMLLLSIGQTWSQNLNTEQITGKVKDAQTNQLLKGVNLRVEADGKLVPGKDTDDAGRFTIDLPRSTEVRHAENKKPMMVNFTKDGYEQIILVLDCHGAAQSACHHLDEVVLTPLPDSGVLNAEVTIDPYELDILDEHYPKDPKEAAALYFLPLTGSDALRQAVEPMLQTFQQSITDHFQALPVVPPPEDITSPPVAELVTLNDLEVPLEDAEKIQLYGRYLKALAMINSTGNIWLEDGAEVAQLTFHYRTIQFNAAFAPIREIYSYKVPVAHLQSLYRYEQMSARWGFYTLLALCIRDLRVFQVEASLSNRTKLERVRAYLLAERAQLPRNEPLKREYIDKLLSLVNHELDKEEETLQLRKVIEEGLSRSGSTQ